MDVLEIQKWSYMEQLPQDIYNLRQLLEQYSKIGPAEVDDHLFSIVSDHDNTC